MDGLLLQKNTVTGIIWAIKMQNMQSTNNNQHQFGSMWMGSSEWLRKEEFQCYLWKKKSWSIKYYFVRLDKVIYGRKIAAVIWTVRSFSGHGAVMASSILPDCSCSVFCLTALPQLVFTALTLHTPWRVSLRVYVYSALVLHAHVCLKKLFCIY